jgi:hypothetical protein
VSCVHTTERYTEWREGTLPFWPRLRLRIHLLYCPGCPIYVRQMDQTVETLRGLEAPDVAPPDSLLEKLRSG